MNTGRLTLKLICIYLIQSNEFKFKLRYNRFLLYTEDQSQTLKPEDHWFRIAHLSAEDTLKSVVIEEKR